MSTVHIKPNAQKGVFEQIVIVPVTVKCTAFPNGRGMFVAYVKDSLFERPVYTTRECFTADGAGVQAVAWAIRNGYLPVERLS